MRAFPVDPKLLAHLDRTLHEPVRLSVAACLYFTEEADFVFLQSQIGITGGNLSSHLKKLHENGYVEIRKGFQGARPRTSLSLTPAGRAAFVSYLGAMKQLIQAVDPKEKHEGGPARRIP